MLTELHLENWKSYQQATLYIDPISVLIGVNASGKSNALDALQWLNRLATGQSLTAALKGEGGQSPIRGGLEWAARQPGSQFTLSVLCHADTHTDYRYRISGVIYDNRCQVQAEQLTRLRYRQGKDGARKSLAGEIQLLRTDPAQADAPSLTARLYNAKQGSPRQLSRSHAVLFQLVGQKLRQEIHDGVSTVVDTLRNIFILDPIPSHMRGYSALAEQLAPDASNIAGVLAALADDAKHSIEATLTRYARQLPERDILRVYAETIGKFNSDAMLYCEENWHPGQPAPTVDARGMSDGTLRFLAILTALLTRPAGSLLVIEEVDNGLHPSRAQLLLDMLSTVGSERQVDVLLTTHNPALLDSMGVAMSPFITVTHRDDATGASTLTLLEDIAQLPKLLGQGPIGYLSSRGVIERSLAGQAHAQGAEHG